MELGAFLRLTVIAVMLTAAASQTTPTGYANHTVGGSAGWFFNSTTNTSAANYSSWAATQTFNLGDFLSKLHFCRGKKIVIILLYCSHTFLPLLDLCSFQHELESDGDPDLQREHI